MKKEIQSGHGIKEVRNPHLGQAMRAKSSARWRHPWYTSARWDWQQSTWVATVKAGFVNGECPVIRVLEEAEEETTLSVAWKPLYEHPELSLSFRNLGWDGDGDVPLFFQERGVQRPMLEGFEAELSAGAMNVDRTKREPGSRLLRACDIVLRKPRVALTSEVNVQAGFVTGTGTVIQTLGLRSPAANDRLRVHAVSQYQAAGLPTIDPLSFQYEEPTWDERLISTVFLLSPPDEPDNSEPDFRWVPFVRHSLFWNLCWEQPAFRQLDNRPDIPYIPPLGGGAATLVANFLTSSLNDAVRDMINMVQAHSMAGRWWVATCGGSDAMFPVEEIEEEEENLDKKDRLGKEEEKERQVVRERRLDPPWPYQGLAMPMTDGVHVFQALSDETGSDNAGEGLRSYRGGTGGVGTLFIRSRMCDAYEIRTVNGKTQGFCVTGRAPAPKEKETKIARES